MKILYVIETGGPGGAEQAFLKTILEMKKRGVTCLAASFREGWLTNKLDEENIPHYIINAKNSKFACIRKLFNLIRQYQVDLVHSHLLDTNFYASIACTLSGVPHIGTEHGDIHHSTKRKWIGLKTKITSLLTSKIIAVSEYTKSALVSHGMKESKIAVLGNPFDFNSPHDDSLSAVTRTSYHDLPSIPDTDWIWIHVANLRPVKDQTTLLRGFALSESRLIQPQHLLIVGDGTLRDELMQLADNLGISTQVHFLGFRDDVEKLLSLSNGFILSSISEATPVSLLEAAKHRLVLLATDTGGIPELVDHGTSGYLYPRRSPEKLAEMIDFIMSNKEKAQDAASKAHSMLKEKCSTEHVVGALIEIYKSQTK
jgi:glycosyltransferase involved in cell wall biosynthesis